VPAVVDAAIHAMPGWLPAATIAKFVLTTLGSLVVIVLLAAPPAGRYCRTD
jgi:hypothetical protein